MCGHFVILLRRACTTARPCLHTIRQRPLSLLPLARNRHEAVQHHATTAQGDPPAVPPPRPALPLRGGGHAQFTSAGRWEGAISVSVRSDAGGLRFHPVQKRARLDDVTSRFGSPTSVCTGAVWCAIYPHAGLKEAPCGSTRLENISDFGQPGLRWVGCPRGDGLRTRTY